MLARAGIYLDINAGAPLRPQVVEALLSFLSPSTDGERVLLPNPSSIHTPGRDAKRRLTRAREQVARSLGSRTVRPEQIVFTSSGTESNQLAIRCVLEPLFLEGRKPHWILAATEHDSVLRMIPWVERQGGSVSLLPVDDQGLPRLDRLSELWKPETALVSLIWVNNETGVLIDPTSWAREIRSRGAHLHLDGAQAWGKIHFDLGELGADYVSFSGHKIGALPGSGALWMADAAKRGASTVLGSQEEERRGGTENLLGAIAMGAAASVLNPEEWGKKTSDLRDRMESEVLDRVSDVIINGARVARVGNTSSLSFQGISGGLIPSLDLQGYFVSAGSACSAGTPEPSHVLLAMGRTKEEALSSVRVSLSEDLRWDDCLGFVSALETSVRNLRESRSLRKRG